MAFIHHREQVWKRCINIWWDMAKGLLGQWSADPGGNEVTTPSALASQPSLAQSCVSFSISNYQSFLWKSRLCNSRSISTPVTCFPFWFNSVNLFPPYVIITFWAFTWSSARLGIRLQRIISYIGHSFCTCRSEAWIEFLAVPLFSCVTLVKLLNHSVPQFHL